MQSNSGEPAVAHRKDPPAGTSSSLSKKGPPPSRLRADSDDYELTLSFDDLSYWERIVSLGVAVSEDFQCRTLALLPIGVTLIGLTTVVSMDCAFCFHRGRNGHFCPLNKLPTLSTAAASGGYGARLSWRWGLSTCAVLLLATVLVFSYRISPLLISTSSQLEKHGGDGGVNDHQSLLGSRRRERMSQRDNRRSLSNNSSKNRRNRVCSCVPAAIARKLCCSCQVHELVEISNLPSLLLWSTITCSISLVFLAHSEAWHVPSVHFSAAVIYWLSSFAILLTLVNIRRCAWDIFPRKNGHQRKKVTFGADVDIELGPVSSRSTFNNDRQRLNDHGSGSKETTLTNRDTLPMSEAEMRLRERRAGALPPPWDCNHRCHRYGWQWLSEVFVGGAALCSIVTLALRWRAQGQPEGDERLHLGWQGLAQQVAVVLQLLSIAPLWADLVAASPAGAVAALMNARHQVLERSRRHSRADVDENDAGFESDDVQGDTRSRRRRRERAACRSSGE